jgi:exodeoxyribonuclease V alpha subunit
VLGDICGAGAKLPGYSRAFADQVARLIAPLPEAMVAHSAVPPIRDRTVHLERSYRFDERSGIYALSRAINAGEATESLALLGQGAARPALAAPHIDLVLVELRHPEELASAMRTRIVDGYRPAVVATDPGEALAALDGFRVLCAHRRGPFGAEQLNAQVRRWLAAEGLVVPVDDWYAGRPILVAENDYDLQLFNGDTGMILPEARGTAALRAFFPGASGAGARSLPLSRLPAHETVFAMTIHKSQGSEFDHVVVVLPERESPILTRELLYTAVTRASRSVTVVGTAAVIAHSIGQRVCRASGIREQLWCSSRACAR